MGGIKQLIVCVNKMDEKQAAYSEERFTEIKTEMQRMLTQVGWTKQEVTSQIPVIPISGWKGDNLLKPTENMPWWKGVDVKVGDKTIHVHTLHDALDKMVSIPTRPVDAPFRMPVSANLKIKGVGNVICGRIEQGTLKPGQEVKFMPTHTAANSCLGKVFTIEMHHKNVPQAIPGDNIGINMKNLNKDNMPKKGDIMVSKNDETVIPAKRITAMVQTLVLPGPLGVGYSPLATSVPLTLPCGLPRSSRSVPRRLVANGPLRSSNSPPTPPLRLFWFLNNPSLAIPSTTALTLPVSPCSRVTTAAPSVRSPRLNKLAI